jgi:hypothetical protein
MRNKLPGIIFLILCFSSVALQGQKNINSPYSRFNIGALSQSGPFRCLGMGGVGVAARDDNAVYYYNPASYTSIDTVSFLFDFGIDRSTVGLDDGTNKFSSSDLNFNHLLIGFPVSRKFGFAAGLVPASNGSYFISQTVTTGDPGYDPNTGDVTYVHQGSGSLSNLFVGTGFKLTKKLSLGVNMNIVFGELTRINEFEFGDYANTYNENSTENLRIHGIHFDYGIQYSTKIKSDYFITAGFTYTAPARFSSSREMVSTKFTDYTTAPVDTLSYSNSQSKDSTKFPGSYKAGIAFGKTDKFTIEIDYVYTGWANALIYGDNSNLANTSAWMLGIEFIPDKFSNEGFLKRVEYRVGGHISDDYLTLNGSQLKDYGGSIGLGLRLRKTPSKANVFFDYTRRVGDLSKGMYNENIFSIGISLNLYDSWFRQRKYD